MNRKIQLISVLVFLILGLSISPIESQSSYLVSKYIDCTEITSDYMPTDATFKRRLAGIDTLDKAMTFYKKIYTEYNSTSNSALRKCMFGDENQNTHMYDDSLFLNQDFFNSFSKVVGEIKTAYKVISVDKLNDYFLQYFQKTHPFFVDFFMKYEHSIFMFFYYKETIPCANLFIGKKFKTMSKSKFIKSFEPNCPEVDLDTASPQQLEDSIKCVLKEMSPVCVRPVLRYYATVIAGQYPQIIKGDLYSYASSLTNNFPDSINLIESPTFNLVKNYISCAENIFNMPSDDIFKSELTTYDTFDKAMSFYQKIYTEYNSTFNWDLKICMGNYYSDGHLFLNQEFFKSFSKAVNDLKMSYKLLPIDNMDNGMKNFYQKFKESHPFFVNFVLKYEYSNIILYYYKETTKCAEYFTDINSKSTIRSNRIGFIRYETKCPNIESNANPEEVKESIKCKLEEMSTVCVKPALRLVATILVAKNPEIIVGDMSSYVSSITDSLPDPINSSPCSSFAFIYLTIFFVTLYSFLKNF